MESLVSDNWTLYHYAMKSQVTRDKYQKRLGEFLESLRFQGDTIQQKSRVYVETSGKDSSWTFNNIFKCIQFQNSRVIKKQISGATVRNYVTSFKSFCEMA